MTCLKSRKATFRAASSSGSMNADSLLKHAAAVAINDKRLPRSTANAASSEKSSASESKRAAGQATASGRIPLQANSRPASKSSGGGIPSRRTSSRNSTLEPASRMRSSACRGIAAECHAFHSIQ